MRNVIKNKSFDEERALYALCDTDVSECRFEGEADGESAFKEARNISVDKCLFKLRYPFWHTKAFALSGSEMTDTARAALWYCEDGKVNDCILGGIKALRECENITLENCTGKSAEFGWRCKGIKVEGCKLESEYFFFESRDLYFNNFFLKGKYSFQYNENLVIENSVLDTKDSFWHAKNVTVKNSEVKGEYLGWYSDGLTLENCTIIGTQPFCYCKNLRLINCKMIDADLAFEYSDVHADVVGDILSVKNPSSGRIVADSIGEIIIGNAVYPNTCEITTRK